MILHDARQRPRSEFLSGTGRAGNVHALLAVAVNAEGYREILGLQVSSAEDGAGCHRGHG